MTLDEVIAVMKAAEADGKITVRLHTGEPSIYGAVREQMDELDTLLIPYESCPGVSACFGAAASLNIEYTLPGISQSLIITRMEGRTKVPPKESIASFAAHHASMAIYLSTGLLEKLTESLIEEDMRQIHLLQLYIRQPGHRRRHTCALSLHWSGLRESTISQRQRLCLWGMS